MMITVTKEISETEREEWGFNLFEANIVFVKWLKLGKPKGKHTWKIVEFWDIYNERDSTEKQPELTFGVRAEALQAAKDLMKVKTWKEFKGEYPPNINRKT